MEEILGKWESTYFRIVRYLDIYVSEAATFATLTFSKEFGTADRCARSLHAAEEARILCKIALRQLSDIVIDMGDSLRSFPEETSFQGDCCAIENALWTRAACEQELQSLQSVVDTLSYEGNWEDLNTLIECLKLRPFIVSTAV